jgi:hypothetical protein
MATKKKSGVTRAETHPGERGLTRYRLFNATVEHPKTLRMEVSVPGEPRLPEIPPTPPEHVATVPVPPTLHPAVLDVAVIVPPVDGAPEQTYGSQRLTAPNARTFSELLVVVESVDGQPDALRLTLVGSLDGQVRQTIDTVTIQTACNPR